MRGTALILGLLLVGPAAAQEQPYADEVARVVEGELAAWIADPLIIGAIRESNTLNAGLTPAAIAALDQRWIAEGGRGPMSYDLLDRQASILVRDRRELSGGVITEIIVMDALGLNAAISDPTSDYFQGDEPKWSETFLKGPGARFVDAIAYDESTRQVQAQISLSVVDPDTGAAIGAVTFGINLDVLGSAGTRSQVGAL